MGGTFRRSPGSYTILSTRDVLIITCTDQPHLHLSSVCLVLLLCCFTCGFCICQSKVFNGRPDVPAASASRCLAAASRRRRTSCSRAISPFASDVLPISSACYTTARGVPTLSMKFLVSLGSSFLVRSLPGMSALRSASHCVLKPTCPSWSARPEPWLWQQQQL